MSLARTSVVAGTNDPCDKRNTGEPAQGASKKHRRVIGGFSCHFFFGKRIRIENIT